MTSAESLIQYYSEHDLSRRIRRSYSVQAEIERVQEMMINGVDPERISVYLKEQLMKFLLEHIAGVKKTSFSYELKGDDLYYPGMDNPVSTMFNRSAQLAGDGSREMAELRGWEKIVHQFNSGASRVLQLSPPSNQPEFGDYGMAFLFERDERGGHIHTHALRYANRHEKRTLAQTKQIGNAFGIPYRPHMKEQGYLLSPINVSHFAEGIYSKLSELGISFFDAESVNMEALLHNDLVIKMYMRQYIETCMGDIPHPQKAYYLLEKITERACLCIAQYKIPFYPPLFMGTGCMVTGYEYVMPVYRMYIGEKRVTTCPGCKTSQLINSIHSKSGIKCFSCHNMVEGGPSAQCIVESSRIASNNELSTLRDAESAD